MWVNAPHLYGEPTCLYGEPTCLFIKSTWSLVKSYVSLNWIMSNHQFSHTSIFKPGWTAPRSWRCSLPRSSRLSAKPRSSTRRARSSSCCPRNYPTRKNEDFTHGFHPKDLKALSTKHVKWASTKNSEGLTRKKWIELRETLDFAKENWSSWRFNHPFMEHEWFNGNIEGNTIHPTQLDLQPLPHGVSIRNWICRANQAIR